MPKFNSNRAVVINTSTGNEQFFTVQPGTYMAVVRKIEDKEPFMANFAGYENPNTPDGKWEMCKITPEFELMNERRTIIGRQDLTIGVMVDGVPYSPNPKNSAVYSGWYNSGKDPRGGSLGAAGLLKAVGCMIMDGQEATFTGDTNDVKDAIVWVKTGVGAYSKAKVNYGPDEFLTFLTEQNDGVLPPFNDYYKVLEVFNAPVKGTDAELKMKNFVMEVWALTDDEVAANGFFRAENGAVYATRPAGVKPAVKSAKAMGAAPATSKPRY